MLEVAVRQDILAVRTVHMVRQSDKRAARAGYPVLAAPAGFPASAAQAGFPVSASPEDSLAVAAVRMADCRVADRAWVYREDFQVVSPETVLYRPQVVARAQSFRCH